MDAEDEIDRLVLLSSELDRVVRVKLRLKLLPPAFAETQTDHFGGGRGLLEYVRRVKWGFSLDAAEPLVRRLREIEGLSLRGYHFHIGRASQSLEFQQVWARALADAVAELHCRTQFAPSVIDVGGGWPRERDPESRSLDLNPVGVEGLRRCHLWNPP